MKKTFIYITISIIGALLFGFDNVHAINDSMKGYAGEGRATLLCEYADENGEVQGRIYYYFVDKTTSNAVVSPWWAFYRRNESLILLHDKSNGMFYNVFGGGNDDIYFQSRTKEDDFRCPNNFFIRYAGLKRNKICFKDGSSCGSDFDAGPFSLSESGSESETIYHAIDQYENDYITNMANTSALRAATDKRKLVHDETRKYIKNKYSFDTKYMYPAFVENYITRFVFDETDFNIMKDNISKAIDRDVTAGNITPEQAATEKKALLGMSVSTTLNPVATAPSPEVSDELSCSGLLGDDMTKIVKNLFSFIKYLGPLLVAVLSIADFAKAALSGDEGNIKKAYQKLIKRIACAILLFFIPIICGVLFEVAGITVPDICID